jgi:hypothetical protein
MLYIYVYIYMYDTYAYLYVRIYIHTYYAHLLKTFTLIVQTSIHVKHIPAHTKRIQGIHINGTYIYMSLVYIHIHVTGIHT